MIELFSALIGNLLEDIVRDGIERVREKGYFLNFQILAKERLVRELNYNGELIKEIQRLKKLKTETSTKRISTYIETLAFDSIVESGIPISEVFNSSISDDLLEKTNFNPKEKNHIDVTSTSELLERTYHRIKILQMRLNIGADNSDLSYLSKLVRCSVEHLKRSKAVQKKAG